ncbi:MAG: cytochrome c oxidase accessory protein CcoG [Chromatiales bacterium]|jgi:cytochrome c oxidase accessory protein FixG
MSDEADVQLYARRVPIFPRSVKGRFRNLKNLVLALAYGVYFLLPWLRWERPSGPDQAVLLDLPGRLFYLFDLVVHPQDIFWLTGFLVIAAWLLFLVTGIAGRVFCGYFCFQTLWTDVFVFIERLVQGERPARIRLSKQSWGPEKLAKLGLTHLLWLSVAFLTGFTFVMYWGNAPDLALAVFKGEAPFPAYATIAFLTATTYVMAGLAREQVCTYMCPYARFQSVMFDRDTLIVSYDEARGEGTNGRAKVRRGSKTREERAPQGLGDCIDCGYCVQVCPTGIDIRNGLQLQCIHCALCVDACDSIMDNIGWPRGLIRYTSDNELAGGKTRLVKPKTIGYALGLSVAIGFLLWGMLSQAKMDAAVSQVRQPLYVVLSDGSIQNSYEIKVNNKTPETVTVDVAIEGLDGAELDLGRIEQLVIEPEKSGRLFAKVRWGENSNPARKQHDLDFEISVQGRDDIAPIRIESHFFTP